VFAEQMTNALRPAAMHRCSWSMMQSTRLPALPHWTLQLQPKSLLQTLPVSSKQLTCCLAAAASDAAVHTQAACRGGGGCPYLAVRAKSQAGFHAMRNP